uniref:Helix-hairpin-helix DNA-binding motif class 1 domain-containing protein n=1 Tax=candidate division CPR3 bacterium TaxID=2268181 RepID=A0A7V3J9T1_UNCC3
MKIIDKYYRAVGIFLVLAILGGGGGIIYKEQRLKTTQPSQIQNKTPQISNLKPISSKINLNLASQKELEGLPGIGPTKAKAIIEYRRKNGNFGSKRDIMKVKGIGEKTYEKIKNLIEVN